MTDRTDTAKRMAASPKWVWREGMKCCASDHGPIHLGPCIPDLTDWATTGIILGMIMEICGAPRLECTRTGRWFAAAGIETVFATRMYLYPGQALGELWLESVA